MSVIVKIIKAEKTAEKNATKRLIDNADDIIKEAKTIASLRAKYRGKEFVTHMALAGFASLAERDQRNNLSAIVWLADEGTELFKVWCAAAEKDRSLCSTIRGIKKAVTPKAERKPRQPEGEKEEGENVTIKAPRDVAAILKNALDQCLAAGIAPEDFIEYANSEQARPIFDAAIDKSAQAA